MPRTFHAAVPVLIATGLAVLLSGCPTLSTIDELPREAEKGWVVFVSDERLPIRVARIADGSVGELHGTQSTRGTPVATACPPGRNDFLVREGSGETRITVPVVEGMVTYVGVAMQVIAEAPNPSYHVRVSVGTHPLPFRPDAQNPAPLVTALADHDWATRWAAIRALARISPPLEPAATPTLEALAREDPFDEVRAAAQAVLRSARKPLPADPLAFIGFGRSAAGWPLGEGLASATSLLPEGYLLEVKDSQATAWRNRDGGEAVIGREEFDVLLECRWVGGDGTAAYGLTLGSGTGTFDVFCVSRSGGAAVLRYAGGRTSPAPVPWTYGAAPAITGTPVSRIEVAKRGSRYELSVNGEVVGGFSEPTGPAVCRLGVFVDGAQSVVFRKIIVTAP